ncbi:MAG: hypothetical protein FWF56_04980 [Firmicutes bacterium]|nr:hypothetical protein [Bacillota bacterium]MCL1954161.1 hypothetical protein [Bacillota bacterium]
MKKLSFYFSVFLSLFFCIAICIQLFLDEKFHWYTLYLVLVCIAQGGALMTLGTIIFNKKDGTVDNSVM